MRLLAFFCNFSFAASFAGMLALRCIAVFTRHGMCTMAGPTEQRIYSQLSENLKGVSHLEVKNESYMHNVPNGSETHFRVLVVAEEFEGVGHLQRHRRINTLLKEELDRVGGVHALAIEAKTPKQWKDGGQLGPSPSPPCKGGFGK